MSSRARILLALACALVLAAPSLASAAGGGTASQAITDCNTHGQLTTHYSPGVLRQALAQMPADVREYTDCYDVIQRQLLKQIGASGSGGTSTGGSSSGGGSFLPVWLIVVIVLLALAAVTLGMMAVRRRAAAPETGPGGSTRAAPEDPDPTESSSDGPPARGGPGAT